VSTNDLPDWAQVVSQPDTVLVGSPAFYTPPSYSATFDMPTGTHVLSIAIQDYTDVTSLEVNGLVTGIVYLRINPSQQTYQNQYLVTIPSGTETQVGITVESSVEGSMWVTGISDTVAVAVLPQNPAPWQGPTGPSAFFSFQNPGPGASAQIIASPGLTKSLWLHSMWWLWSVASTNVVGTFQDGISVVTGADMAVTAGVPRYMDHKGQRLAPDGAFVFKQSGSAAAGTSTCFGGVTYSVY